MQTITETVKEARHRANLTQVQLAELARIADATYIDFERGNRNPRLDTLVRVADALGLRLALVANEDSETLKSVPRLDQTVGTIPTVERITT